MLSKVCHFFRFFFLKIRPWTTTENHISLRLPGGGQMKHLLILLFFSITTYFAQASTVQSFTNDELHSLSPFETDNQIKTLKQVLLKMNLKFNEDFELPEIRISESVKESESEIVRATESQGMPYWALAKGVNIYLFQLNIILLGKERKIHNLAHEFVHYAQLKYKSYDTEDFGMDFVEMEAIEIQHQFRPTKK